MSYKHSDKTKGSVTSTINGKKYNTDKQQNYRHSNNPKKNRPILLEPDINFRRNPRFNPKKYKLIKYNQAKVTYLNMGVTKGSFTMTRDQLYHYIVRKNKINKNALKYCFVEKKSPYYTLFWDFDICDKIEQSNYLLGYFIDNNINLKEFWEYVIDHLIKTLQYYIIDDGDRFKYIYSNKKKCPHKLHLYFPNIVINNVFALTIRKKLVNMIKDNNVYKLNDKYVENIVDECVFIKNGLRLLFQYKIGEKHYYTLNTNKSTYKNIPKDKLKQLYLVSIKSKVECINFDMVLNDKGFPKLENDKEIIKIKTKKTYRKKKNREVNDVDKEYLEDNYNPCYIRELAESLSNDRMDNYQKWINFVFMCSNYEWDELAHDMSKRSSKYKKNEVDDLLQKGCTADNLLTVGSLHYWAEKDNKILFESIKKKYPFKKIVKYNHTDDILLKYYKNNFSKTNKNFYEENCKYTSKKAMAYLKRLIRNNNKVITFHENTGNGKSYTMNKLTLYKIKQLLKTQDIVKVLSVVTRQSMVSTHLLCFKQVGLTSYMDKNLQNINYNKYIISLEQVAHCENYYDIVLLDECTNLFTHFYSRTMDHKRYLSLVKLVKLVKNAKLVLCADAIMTDMCFAFLENLRQDVFYYRNKYKNKENIPINAYFVETNKHTLDDKIITFLDKIVPDVKQNKSILIFCDSAIQARKIRNYMSYHNNNSDYFRLYTSKEFDLKEVLHCNKVWKNRCVIASPKIVYGVDCQVEYDSIWAIYKCHTINSFNMVQQIGRARICKEINILFLKLNYHKKFNGYIPFDLNSKLEQELLNNYLSNMKDIANKQNYAVIMELCSRITDKAEIDENCIFGKIHLFKSWYDRLFDYNKSQLLFSLCEEQGYIIKECVLDGIKKSGIMDDSMELYENELKNHTLKYFNKKYGAEIDKLEDIKDCTKQFSSYKSHVNVIEVEIKNRLNYLGVYEHTAIKDPLLKEIVLNKKIFDGCVKSLPLYYSKKDIKHNRISEFTEGLAFIEKDNRVWKRVELLAWIERMLKIDRFDVHKINTTVDEIKNFVKKIQMRSDILCGLIDYRVCNKKQVKKRYEGKIKKITSNDRLCKFVADVYNMFDDIISYDIKRKQYRCKGKMKATIIYLDFKINKNVLLYHNKIRKVMDL